MVSSDNTSTFNIYFLGGFLTKMNGLEFKLYKKLAAIIALPFCIKVNLWLITKLYLKNCLFDRWALYFMVVQALWRKG